MQRMMSNYIGEFKRIRASGFPEDQEIAHKQQTHCLGRLLFSGDSNIVYPGHSGPPLIAADKKSGIGSA